MPAKMVLLSATCPEKNGSARTEMSRSLQAQLITRGRPPGKIPEIRVGNFPERFGTFCGWRVVPGSLRSWLRTGGAKEAGTEWGRTWVCLGWACVVCFWCRYPLVLRPRADGLTRRTAA